MKTKILINLISIYMLISGVICLCLFFILIWNNDISAPNVLIMMVFSFVMMVATLINNIKSLMTKNALVLCNCIMVNIIIFIVQIFTIVSDGFYFGYTQGGQLFFFVNFELLTNDVKWGGVWSLVIYEFMLKFEKSQNIMIGINIIPLIGLVISFLLMTKYKKKINADYKEN